MTWTFIPSVGVHKVHKSVSLEDQGTSRKNCQVGRETILAEMSNDDSVSGPNEIFRCSSYACGYFTTTSGNKTTIYASEQVLCLSF